MKQKRKAQKYTGKSGEKTKQNGARIHKKHHMGGGKHCYGNYSLLQVGKKEKKKEASGNTVKEIIP